jgi:hypothetical protein
MIIHGIRQERGSAVRWVLVLVVLGGLVFAFRDSFSGMLKTEGNTTTPRGAIRLFTQGLIDRDEAAVVAQCKPGREEQGRQALTQLNQIADSNGMSKPKNMAINSGNVGNAEVGKTLNASVVISGENRDPGANLMVTVEFQPDQTWKVIEALVIAVEGGRVIDY